MKIRKYLVIKSVKIYIEDLQKMCPVYLDVKWAIKIV